MRSGFEELSIVYAFGFETTSADWIAKGKPVMRMMDGSIWMDGKVWRYETVWDWDVRVWD